MKQDIKYSKNFSYFSFILFINDILNITEYQYLKCLDNFSPESFLEENCYFHYLIASISLCNFWPFLESHML